MMVSLMKSMLSSFCSASNRFLNSSWNWNFYDLICVASTLGGLLVINVPFPPVRPVFLLLASFLW